MSASTLVDLAGTCFLYPSLQSGNGTSGQACGLSGIYVGQSVDLLNANSFTNVVVNAIPALASGNLLVYVQTADNDVSGQYTDPTSGLQTLPTVFSSGGVLWISSGATGGIFNSGVVSGQAYQSGFMVAAGFQRPQRFARLMMGSGHFIGQLQAGFISQLKVTGSGGGFTMLPSSGAVNV